MSTKLIIDFSENVDITTGNESGSPSVAGGFGLPQGVYHINGVLTRDQTKFGSFFLPTAGRTSSNSFIGYNQGAGQAYLDLSGSVIGVNRAQWGIGSEIWTSFDITGQYIVMSATASAQTASQYPLLMFRWGDVTVQPKSLAYSVTTFTTVFSVRNNAVEVATITVPGLTQSGFLYCQFHVSLHSSSGIIECAINGISQSVVYTASNTVANQSLNSTGTLSSSDHIYYGPPVLIAPPSTYYNVGGIGNIYIDDSQYATGRPLCTRWIMATSSVDVNFTAVGTGSSTVPNALKGINDTHAARGAVGGTTLINMTPFSNTGSLNPNILGFNIYTKKVANRDAATPRQLSTGISIGGVHTMGSGSAGMILPTSAVSNPPNSDYSRSFDGIYNTSITTASMNDVKIRLLVS
jgi:hypothetical protein